MKADYNFEPINITIHTYKASLLYPIITIKHSKLIGINLIGILKHVNKSWILLSSNVFFKTFIQLT